MCGEVRTQHQAETEWIEPPIKHYVLVAIELRFVECGSQKWSLALGRKPTFHVFSPQVSVTLLPIIPDKSLCKDLPPMGRL